MSHTTEIVALNAMLNGLGEQGWELVSAIPEDDATFLIYSNARAASSPFHHTLGRLRSS